MLKSTCELIRKQTDTSEQVYLMMGTVLRHELTAQDTRDSRKRGFNVYAFAQHLGIVEQIRQEDRPADLIELWACLVGRFFEESMPAVRRTCKAIEKVLALEGVAGLSPALTLRLYACRYWERRLERETGRQWETTRSIVYRMRSHLERELRHEVEGALPTFAELIARLP